VRGARIIVIAGAYESLAKSLATMYGTKAVIIADDDPACYARTIALMYPERPSLIVGVTGTNGKTSTTVFLEHFWRCAARYSASLGGLGLRIAESNVVYGSPPLTTLDAKTLHLLLSTLRTHCRIECLSMEVSSHALARHRVDGIRFDAAAFTNFSPEHQDFHGSMEAYFSAKKRLFAELLDPYGAAILNYDDKVLPNLERAVEAASVSRKVRYSEIDNRCEVTLLSISDRAIHNRYVLRILGDEADVVLSPYDVFQKRNILCAIALANATGVPMETILGGLSNLPIVPGRFELVSPADSRPRVYVDYAHTPSAIDYLLTTLRTITPARLHIVFGCGGDRDRTKRSKMGSIAGSLADVVYVTDDNPRTEDPSAIRREILKGAVRGIEVGERRRAIEVAIRNLGADDVLVVAGRGHEEYPRVYPVGEASAPKELVSDKSIIRELLADDYNVSW
jgi:UDP-N-acetylmuramoyl-L-alanyl-D-glutamate--2,6-diaminopimelate ligase